MGTLAAFKHANALQDGAGNLVMTARADPEPSDLCGPAGPCQFTSSRLTMLNWPAGGTPTWGQRGGHIEARIRAPAEQGLWPAFWTVGSDEARIGWPEAGEIDIFEAVGQRPGTLAQYVHGFSSTGSGKGGDDIRGKAVTLPNHDISDWHTYAVDWDPAPDGFLAWSVDGKITSVVRSAQVGEMWNSLSIPHSLIIDLAVGGWAGAPDPRAFPATMSVDYVRVYPMPAVQPADLPSS